VRPKRFDRFPIAGGVCGCFDNMKYRNKETKRHRKPGTETEAGTAAPGRDGQAPERWEMAVQNRSFFPDILGFFHLFPRFPGFSHLFPLRFYFVAKRGRDSEVRSQRVDGRAHFKVEKCGFMRNKVRIVSRCYAKVHKSSHRTGPWLRDCSDCYGWDSFLIMKPGNEEDRNGKKEGQPRINE